MRYDGHIVVDMDSHIREYADLDRTYREFIDPSFRDAYEQLSSAIAARREAGQTTALFMHPQAVIEPSNEERPLGVYDTFGSTREQRARHTAAEGRLFHAVETGERYVDHCVAELGEDIWLFATDYPHTGSPWPHGVSDIIDRKGLSEDAKRKILGENALRLCPRLAT